MTTTVALVLKDITEQRLRELLASGDAWVAETPGNTAIVQTIWAARDSTPFLGELTTFAESGDSLLDQLAAILETVGDHYGGFSVADGIQRLEVVGDVKPDDVVRLIDFDREANVSRSPDSVIVDHRP